LGDTKNVISTSSASPSFAMFGNTGRAGAYQSIGFGATTDAVWLPNHATTGPFAGGDGQLKLTQAWGIRGAFNHNWDPYWSSSLFGSYSAVRYGGNAVAFGGAFDPTTAKGMLCQAFVGSTGGYLTKSADFSCNPDFNVSQLGVVTRWTPVKNLTFSAEVQWFHLDQKFSGTSILGPTAPKPTTVYEFKDQDTVSLNVRVQRNF
jgi:porin-like protein